MKIKNLKINKKASSKLVACMLAGSLTATMLTGCGNVKNVDRNNILKGTILENTCVVTFDDGSKDIAVVVGDCYGSTVDHYYSIISGEYFSDDTICLKNKIEGTTMYHYSVTNVENISSYLTKDELTKAMNGELNNDDIINIVVNTVKPVAEEPKTKTK